MKYIVSLVVLAFLASPIFAPETHLNKNDESGEKTPLLQGHDQNSTSDSSHSPPNAASSNPSSSSWSFGSLIKSVLEPYLMPRVKVDAHQEKEYVPCPEDFFKCIGGNNFGQKLKRAVLGRKLPKIDSCFKEETHLGMLECVFKALSDMENVTLQKVNQIIFCYRATINRWLPAVIGPLSWKKKDMLALKSYDEGVHKNPLHASLNDKTPEYQWSMITYVSAIAQQYNPDKMVATAIAKLVLDALMNDVEIQRGSLLSACTLTELVNNKYSNGFISTSQLIGILTATLQPQILSASSFVGKDKKEYETTSVFQNMVALFLNRHKIDLSLASAIVQVVGKHVHVQQALPQESHHDVSHEGHPGSKSKNHPKGKLPKLSLVKNKKTEQHEPLDTMPVQADELAHVLNEQGEKEENATIDTPELQTLKIAFQTLKNANFSQETFTTILQYVLQSIGPHNSAKTGPIKAEIESAKTGNPSPALIAFTAHQLGLARTLLFAGSIALGHYQESKLSSQNYELVHATIRNAVEGYSYILNQVDGFFKCAWSFVGLREANWQESLAPLNRMHRLCSVLAFPYPCYMQKMMERLPKRTTKNPLLVQKVQQCFLLHLGRWNDNSYNYPTLSFSDDEMISHPFATLPKNSSSSFAKENPLLVLAVIQHFPDLFENKLTPKEKSGHKSSTEKSTSQSSESEDHKHASSSTSSPTTTPHPPKKDEHKDSEHSKSKFVHKKEIRLHETLGDRYVTLVKKALCFWIINEWEILKADKESIKTQLNEIETKLDLKNEKFYENQLNDQVSPASFSVNGFPAWYAFAAILELPGISQLFGHFFVEMLRNGQKCESFKHLFQPPITIQETVHRAVSIVIDVIYGEKEFQCDVGSFLSILGNSSTATNVPQGLTFNELIRTMYGFSWWLYNHRKPNIDQSPKNIKQLLTMNENRDDPLVIEYNIYLRSRTGWTILQSSEDFTDTAFDKITSHFSAPNDIKIGDVLKDSVRSEQSGTVVGTTQTENTKTTTETTTEIVTATGPNSSSQTISHTTAAPSLPNPATPANPATSAISATSATSATPVTLVQPD